MPCGRFHRRLEDLRIASDIMKEHPSAKKKDLNCAIPGLVSPCVREEGAFASLNAEVLRAVHI
jgi:hypothetical protein